MSTARIPDGTPRPMRFAYADPPYPGQAYQYKDHPDYAGEVDHLELINRLEADYPDGWALSTDGRSVQPVLALCPSSVRVAVWHRSNAAPPGGRAGWWWDWEPVIVRGGRPGPVRTTFISGQNGAAGRFLGSKPPGFTRWMLGLLGASIDDTIDDLFPGSGAVSLEIESWRRQPTLAPVRYALEASKKDGIGRLARDLRLNGHPSLLDEIAVRTADAAPQDQL